MTSTSADKLYPQTFIFYLRKSPAAGAKRGFPISCVAVSVTASTISYQLAVHNPVDTFDKRFMREQAYQRVMREPFVIYHYKNTAESKRDEIIKAVMCDIAKNERKLPFRAERAARKWLKQV